MLHSHEFQRTFTNTALALINNGRKKVSIAFLLRVLRFDRFMAQYKDIDTLVASSEAQYPQLKGAFVLAD